MSIERLEQTPSHLSQEKVVDNSPSFSTTQPRKKILKNVDKVKNAIFALAFIVYSMGDVLQDLRQGTVANASFADIIAMLQTVVSTTYQFYLMCVEKVISLFV